VTKALDTQADPHYKYLVHVIRTTTQTATVEIVVGVAGSAGTIATLAAMEADRIGVWSPAETRDTYDGLARGERVKIVPYVDQNGGG
jgi:hypothetical protein